MDLIIIRRIVGPADPPLRLDAPEQPYYHDEVSRALLKNGRWKWERMARTRSLYRGFPRPPKGSVAGRYIRWAEIQPMVQKLVVAENSAALLRAAESDPGVIPILADALEEQGVSENHPLLAILRSWK